MKFLIINGPNLNLLGSREPGVYGTDTLEALQKRLETWAALKGIEVELRQTNWEGAIIDWIQLAAQDGFTGIVLNAGALTHTSYAIHDAIKSVMTPVVEVHISNIYARDDFRHTSLLAPVCAGHISGMGFFGYQAALGYLLYLYEHR
jgi:3-dehydroquinate dehydratase-2